MTWEGDLGDEHIRFTAAKVNPSGDREYFTHGEEATLAIEYEVTKPHPDLIIGFGIWNQRNQLLARSSTSDAPQETAHLVEKGKHTVSFPINPNLFHEGEYCIKLDCQLFRHKNILNDDILLKFPIFAPKQETRFSTASEKEGIYLGNSWSRT